MLFVSVGLCFRDGMTECVVWNRLVAKGGAEGCTNLAGET